MSKRTGRIKWSEVTQLKKGGVFTHGSIAELKRLKGDSPVTEHGGVVLCCAVLSFWLGLSDVWPAVNFSGLLLLYYCSTTTVVVLLLLHCYYY